MASTLCPYIAFRDDAREAMEFYRDVLGGATNTTAVHGDLVNPLGPYVHSNTGGNAPRWNFTPSKGLERTDLCADIDINAHIVPEFT